MLDAHVGKSGSEAAAFNRLHGSIPASRPVVAIEDLVESFTDDGGLGNPSFGRQTFQSMRLLFRELDLGSYHDAT